MNVRATGMSGRPESPRWTELQKRGPSGFQRPANAFTFDADGLDPHRPYASVHEEKFIRTQQHLGQLFQWQKLVAGVVWKIGLERSIAWLIRC